MKNRSLAACLLVALALRLTFVLIGFPFLQPRWHLREDGDGYGRLAQSIRAGQYQDVTRGPVYPFFVAAAGSPLAVKFLQAILDTATVALVWWLAVAVVGRRRDDQREHSRPALVAAWLWAVYPLAVWRVAFVNKEILLTFLLLSYLCLQLRALAEDQTALWLASGVLLGLINLCKPTFLLWPLVIAAFAWRRHSAAGKFAGFFLATVLVIAPWTWRNYRVTGGAFLPVATEIGGKSTFVGNYQPSLGAWEGPGRPLWEAAAREIERQHPGASAVDLDRAFYRAAWQQITAHPFKAAELAVLKTGRFWFVSTARRELPACLVLQVFYLGMALVGLWAERRTVSSRTTLLVALLFYTMALHAISYADVRYSLLVMPIVAVFAAAGLDALAARRGCRSIIAR